MIAFKLLGLEDVISIGKVAPQRTDKGWEFSLDEGGVDPVLGIRYLPEIYAETDPEYTGRATVPTIVDVKTRKVVNNDYHCLTNYHLCCLVTNPHQILPLGPEEKLLEQLPKAKIIYGSGMDV